MTRPEQKRYSTSEGYMTTQIRMRYIESAIATGQLPENAHRMRQIISLEAPESPDQPVQFWQLYSLLGQHRIVTICHRFYTRVFKDESWFRSVFERVGGLNHHINTQASMWIDVMGGGHAYHGGEFRLNFHHTHNAMALMNDRGAERWVKLMVETLDDPKLDLTNDSRVRPAINTFLHFFFSKYAADFAFSDSAEFGEINAPVKRKINFLRMSEEDIGNLPEQDLRDALQQRGIDTAVLESRRALVNAALRL